MKLSMTIFGVLFLSLTSLAQADCFENNSAPSIEVIVTTDFGECSKAELETAKKKLAAYLKEARVNERTMVSKGYDPSNWVIVPRLTLVQTCLAEINRRLDP